MTTLADIENRLIAALDLEPSEDALRWLDARVNRFAARHPSGSRVRARSFPMIVRVLGLAAAFLMLAGAVTAGIGLVDRMLDAAPGWRIAYDRAELLDLSATDAGYTVTLERAYGDVNQVVVVATVSGLPDPRSSDGNVIDHFTIYEADLRGPGGAIPMMMTAIGDVEPGRAATVQSFQFDPPPSAGTYGLTIRSIGYGADGPECVSPCVNDPIEGTWHFAFELPEPAGTVVSTDATDTVDGATLRLTELRVSPTMISARIAMLIGGQPVAYWTFIPSEDDLRHDGTSYGLWSGRHILDGSSEVGPTTEFYTTAGVDEAAGSWEVEIPELDYGLSNDEAIHLTGPWTLKTTIP